MSTNIQVEDQITVGALADKLSIPVTKRFGATVHRSSGRVAISFDPAECRI